MLGPVDRPCAMLRAPEGAGGRFPIRDQARGAAAHRTARIAAAPRCCRGRARAVDPPPGPVSRGASAARASHVARSPTVPPPSPPPPSRRRLSFDTREPLRARPYRTHRPPPRRARPSRRAAHPPRVPTRRRPLPSAQALQRAGPRALPRRRVTRAGAPRPAEARCAYAATAHCGALVVGKPSLAQLRLDPRGLLLGALLRFL